MVRVSGPLRVVTDRPLLVSQVRVRAARDRAERGGLTTALSDSVPVRDGQLDMVVLPGPAVLVLEVTGGFSHAVKLVVPDVAEATLEQCVTAAEAAGDADRRVLDRLAGEVARDVAAVAEAARSAGESASAAAGSARDAGGHADRAAAEADRSGAEAKKSETSSDDSRAYTAVAAAAADRALDAMQGTPGTTGLSTDNQAVLEEVKTRLRGLPKPMTDQVDVAALIEQNRSGLEADHPYSDPSADQVQGMVSAAMSLARGVKPASVPDGAEVIEGYSAVAKRNVRILRSVPGNGLYWGLWVFPADDVVSGVVESPHPVFDGGSDDIAVEVWQRSPAGTVLAVAGSHRTNPDGTNARDVAHNTGSMWHKVTTMIAQPGQPELQLHGFGDDSMPGVGAVVSSGSSPLSAGVIRTEAFIAAAGITTARQWDGSATKLIGMANIQGDVAAQRGNPFLHIELAKTVRDNPQKLVDAIVGAGFLAGENAALLTNEYPKAVGSANSRGSSMTAARADHTHRLVQNDPTDGDVVVRQGGGWRAVPSSQIAPPTPQNVLDATAKVESATYSATAGTIMKRTSTGAVSVADPTAGAHAANKNYVDTTLQQGLDTVRQEVQQPNIVVVDSAPAEPDPSVVYYVAGES